MKLYYAYENWTARSYSPHDVTVHLQGCSHCPFDVDGQRRGPQPSGANDAWHRLGRFESPAEAMRNAKVLVSKAIHFSFCGLCLRGAAEK